MKMNAWVLDRAGPHAQPLHKQLSSTEEQITIAKSAADGKALLRQLAPQRIALGTELTAAIRPVRQAHRADVRNLFFSRVGNTTATLTYRLRRLAVDDELGWATANAVLDSALLAWKKSVAPGRAPKFAAGDRKDQDSLALQFTIKGGLPRRSVAPTDSSASGLGWHATASTPPAPGNATAHCQQVRMSPSCALSDAASLTRSAGRCNSCCGCRRPCRSPASSR